MKIAYLMQAGAPDLRVRDRSGPAAHVVHVVEGLRRLGHDVRLLAQYQGQLWRSDDCEHFERVHVQRTDEGLFRLAERVLRRGQRMLHVPYIHMFESLRFAAAVLQECGDCELYYERMGWMGLGGAMASKRTGRPLVLEVNGDHLAEYEMLGIAPQGLQRKASMRLMNWATRQAALVIATGEGWRRRFVERWPVDLDRVKVVENGSEVVELLPRTALRAWQPEDVSAPVRLIYIGAIEPWHGVTKLVEALALAVRLCPTLHLDLIGAGSKLAEAEALVGTLGLEANVTVHGFLGLEQCLPFLARADIGASPYCGRVEFSGLKLLDYKAAGLATIASGANGQPAVLRHGETGWIVPPCDVEELANAIVELADNPQLRRCIGCNARLEAEAMHSWQHTAEELNTLICELRPA